MIRMSRLIPGLAALVLAGTGPGSLVAEGTVTVVEGPRWSDRAGLSGGFTGFRGRSVVDLAYEVDVLASASGR